MTETLVESIENAPNLENARIFVKSVTKTYKGGKVKALNL